MVSPGAVVAERFEIERLAGQGGMGAVYRARDRLTGELVALKTLHATGAQDAARFAREAAMLGELAHPGIVRYVAHGVTPHGDRYLAIEWLEGETLATRLGREGLTPDEAVAVALQAARALAFLHKRGIVHRDVKPANVFLVGGSTERVKLLDFGVARLADRTRELTLTGVMVGTPGYMAPEQARGERELDARADVFALGCLLFKCLTGRAAFEGPDMLAVLLRIVLEEAPRVRELRPEVPASLDELVARMLSKQPEDRPADGAEVVQALTSLGELGAAGRADPARESLPGLTISEQRVMSLVLARARRPLRGADATISEADLQGRDVALRAVADRHGGNLELLADGSLLVAFAGAGTATDQAVRAARCALGMRSLLSGVGLVVVSGRGVLAARLPIGEVIDRGVRLMNRGGEGVRIDELTAGLVGGRFGVSADDAGFGLSDEREAADATRTLLGKPTPCVGRDRELSSLEGMFLECMSEPVARAVLVTAPAGYGKSRLRYELLRRIEAKGPRDLEIWLGRGDPMSAGSPFSMLAPALRRAAGVLDGEPAEARRRKLAARLARHVAPADLARVTEFLGELVGVPFPDNGSVQLRAARNDAMLMGDQMRRAWLDFAQAETAAGPVVVVLEDLHWGDLPTVKLLDAALRALADRPFMIVALARPEVLELFPRLWIERGVTHVSLGALTRRASEQLVREVLGDTIAPDVVASVLERAGGNAFYLEELIRRVAEGKQDGLPETVLAMVQVRLDGLEPEARRVLRAASVFGQVFWRGGVAGLLGGQRRAAQLDEWLELLAERELVTRRQPARFPDEAEYAFRHALVREAAYAMLTDTDRVLGHRLAAKWLVDAGEADPMVLAEHFERGHQVPLAAGWYRAAAVQALEGNDFEAAVQRAEHAIACLPAPSRGKSSRPPPARASVRPAAPPESKPPPASPDRPEPAHDTIAEQRGAMRLVQAEANRWRGEHAAARSAALEAMRTLRAGTSAWYAAAGEAVLATGRLGEYGELAELAAQLRATPWGPDVTGPQLAATARAGFYLLVAGQNQLAEPLLGWIANVGSEALERDPSSAARVHQIRALKAIHAGDQGRYLEESEASVEAFVRAGDVRNAWAQRGNVAYGYVALGAPERAEHAIRAALTEAEAMGLSTIAGLLRTNLGLALTRMGRAEEACAILAAAVPGLRAQGDLRISGAAQAYLAQALLALGRAAEAAQSARDAVNALSSTPPARAFALATLARAALQLGDRDEAEASAVAAMDLLEGLKGVEEGESLVRLVYAEALHARGRIAEAREAIAVAAERLRERAARISDPSWRASYLERVPEHVRTLALAVEWSAG